MMFGGAIGAVILIIVALSVVELIGGDDEDDDAFPSVRAAEANYDDVQSEPYFLGDPDAPVHVVEWADYQ